MSPALTAALAFLKPAADSLIGTTEAEVPTLDADAIELLENVVAPKLDVPPFLLTLAKTGNAGIEGSLNKFAVAELELLKSRVDGLL
jgi:hypothetical protein